MCGAQRLPCRQGPLAAMSEAALREEFILVGKIIQHLIRAAGVLLVVETPERAAEDDDAAYARRVQRDRVLALNPNFAVE